ncbi:MAG: hypothetical protein ABR542_09935, partial [Desulfonatronovibrio sp.]
ADTWVVNLKHFLNSDGSIAPKSGPALRIAEHFAAIVQEITADIMEQRGYEKVRCRRRPNHKPCLGEIESILDPETGMILWRCPVCGDNGSISGWEESFWDLTEVFDPQ